MPKKQSSLKISKTKAPTIKAQAILPGVAASPGIAVGKAFLLADEHSKTDAQTIVEAQIPVEIERLKNALDKTREEVRRDGLYTENQLNKEQAAIFDYHRLMLDDQYFIADVIAVIRRQRCSAAYAFAEYLDQYAEQFQQKDKIFRERIADVHDIKRRVLRHLRGETWPLLNLPAEATIVVAHELTPSLTLSLDRQKLKAFAADLGGKTSHAALLMRSYGIPAVVGLHNIAGAVKNGDRLIVDGYQGRVLINPDRATLAHYQSEQDKHAAKAKRLAQLRALPAETLDHHRVELAANVEFAEEVGAVMRSGAGGIGLLRTEYLYLGRADLPGEEEQYREYHRIASAVKPQPVIIRTMDLGADKCPQCIDIPAEANPMLGWRAIRISLEKPDLFIAQIKAILRANLHGNVCILLPMISSIDELDKALEVIAQAKRELKQAGQAFEPKTKIGVMIEVPSAALMAETIAERVDFFSIGTNDLVQYLLAVDRGNDRIAHLYANLNPAVLRLIKNVIEAAHRHGVWVGMCGEMAADRLVTPLLVGMGIDELSVSPVDVPEIKKIIRGIDFRAAKKLARQVLAFSTTQEIREFMQHYMRPRFKDIIL